jgi:membrane protein required for colicin V production
MSLLDIILLVIFIFAGFRGYKKGFIGQAAALLGLLLGIWGAIHFSDFTARFLTEQFSLTTPYLSLIAFAITFAGILVGVHFLGVLVEGIFKLAFLGLANKLLGVMFSVLKTALILSVILLLIGKVSNRISIIPDKFGEKSILYGPIERFAPRIFPYLNFDEIKGAVEKTFKPIKET